MSVTGTTSFTQTKDQLILNTFQLMNVYGIGRTVSSEDMSIATSFLNMLIKSWGTKGLHLWCKEEAILYFNQYTKSYGFGNSSSISLTPAYATVASNAHTTQTTASAILGATTLNVLSSTNMTVGNYIGVVQSDLTVFFTTIAAIPNSTSVVLTLGTTQTINSASNVYTFSSLINKPYRIIGARCARGFSNVPSSNVTETMMAPMSHADYYDLPIKDAYGIPNQFYYEPQLDYGVIHVYPTPNDCSYRMHFTYERIIDDVTNTGDNFDLPNEWLLPLTYSLAVLLCPAFGKDKKLQILEPLATTMLNELLDWDTEITGVQFQPDRDGGGIY